MPPKGEALELEVTVGGTKLLMQYRIETVEWRPDATPDERTEQLRTVIRNHEPDWTLVQIGAPSGGTVPITVR
jgi:hypothetical protein